MQISIIDAMTLKDKRRVLHSLKDRLRGKFNISISEVGYNDRIRGSLLGVAIVANEARFADSVLSKVVDFIRADPRILLVDYSIEKV